jgi:hypothetical protein
VLLIVAVAACAAPIAAAASQDAPLAPVTQAPANVTSTSAVLQGVVDDSGGHTVSFWFELGATAAYGARTPTFTTDKAHTDVKRGFGGLTQGTTYHARLVASNEHGTAYGNDITFTTVGVPAATPDTRAQAPGADQGGSTGAVTGTLAPATLPSLVTMSASPRAPEPSSCAFRVRLTRPR